MLWQRLVWSQDVVTFLRRPEDVLKTSVSAGCIQVTFSFEIKLQKYIFFAKYDHFSTASVPFSNPCYDRNVHTYAMTKEARRKAFNAKGENIKQTSAIQVTFILEIKLQKYIF